MHLGLGLYSAPPNSKVSLVVSANAVVAIRQKALYSFGTWLQHMVNSCSHVEQKAHSCLTIYSQKRHCMK